MLDHNKDTFPNEWFTMSIKYTKEVYYKYVQQHGANWRMYAAKVPQSTLQKPFQLIHKSS